MKEGKIYYLGLDGGNGNGYGVGVGYELGDAV